MTQNGFRILNVMENSKGIDRCEEKTHPHPDAEAGSTTFAGSNNIQIGTLQGSVTINLDISKSKTDILSFISSLSGELTSEERIALLDNILDRVLCPNST